MDPLHQERRLVKERGPDRRKGAGRRAGETGARPLEGPPLMTCPHCRSVVPAGDFCGHCGAHLVSESKRRTHSFAASPTEQVAHLAIVTTLFPHLPHRRGAPFRLALVAGGATVLLLAALHLFAPATVAAVCVLPLLYLVYLYEVEIYETEPWVVIGATMVVGAILGIAFNSVLGGSLSQRLMTADQGSALVLAAIVIPIVSQALMLTGPLFLFQLRRRFREPLDGLTFGAASALGFTLASSLAAFWPLLAGPMVASGSTLDWALRLTRVGLLTMLVNACTTSLATAAIWLHRYDRRRAGRPWRTTVPAALGVAFVTQVVLGSLVFFLHDLILQVLVLVLAAAALLLYVRLVIHDALLVEGAEHDIGPDSMCPECHRIVPTMAFCPACGAARSAAPKGKPRVASGA
jgi:RsiW-degrading membrane proteinase PrsW (M82 family)/RNA polymerase subunit RPABC4/transcription elongation factor Spt4